MKEKIKTFLFESILEFRRQRKSGFLFLSPKIDIKTLAQIFSNEYLGKRDTADSVLIENVLSDLVKRKLILPKPVQFSVYQFGASNKYFDVYLKTTDNRIYCRGTTTDLATSYAKAVGELFERTSIQYPKKNDELVIKSFKEVEGDANYLQLKSLPKATSTQMEKFPNFKVTEEDKFVFIKAKNFLTNKEIFIPRQTILFANYLEKEKKLLQSTTHATGAGYTFAQAYESAFFEIVHRHFYLKNWYAHKSPNLLDLDDLNFSSYIPKSLKQKIADLEVKGFRINILDYRNESQIPTFICLLERFGGLYCGGSTNLNLAYAVERSIDEAMSIYIWETKKNIEGKSLQKEFMDNVKGDFVDLAMDARTRVQAFANSYFLSNFDKFFLEGKRVKLDDFGGEYKNNFQGFDLKNYMEKVFGREIFYWEGDNDYLKDYNCFVVKMYIPNSYYFALTEIFSRPILKDNIEPVFTKINIFP